MSKLTKKPKRPVLACARTALAATTMVIAIAGCGDDDEGQGDVGVSVGVNAPDSGADVTESDTGTAAVDAGNDVAPPPGLMAFDAG